MVYRKLSILVVLVVLVALPWAAGAAALFGSDVPAVKWVEFSSPGFANNVSGVIYNTARPPCCGVPIGGVDAGHIDIDARGVYGWNTIFNPAGSFPFKAGWRMPRKLPKAQPFLGMSVGGKTWVLASKEFISGGEANWCTEPYLDGRWADKGRYKIQTVACRKLEGVQPAKEIRYWGHFPVADLEFDTDAPVSVGMRAWAPFLPGDSAGSDTPAAVFEVHLRNNTQQPQQGTIAFNFPGPDSQEALGTQFVRMNIEEDFQGVLVKSDGGVQYIVGVIGKENPRLGAGLSNTTTAWSKIATELPAAAFREEGGVKLTTDSSSSAAVDFSLAPGAEKVVKFLVAWYAPVWEGAYKDLGQLGGTFQYKWMASKYAGKTNYYTHMYASRFDSALDVARKMAVEHESLLGRILAWQNVIYADAKLPVWLKDSLVNNLALIAEDGMWAQPKPPLGDWAFPGGAFAMNESPRGCPDLGCIPCDWYGNLPIVYFFPDLNRSNLKIFKAYQREDGAIAMWIGNMGDLPDFSTPTYFWQQSLNGTCYIDMVDRLWQATGDDTILAEFYDSVKKCNNFMMKLSAKSAPEIRFPDNGGMEWFEHGEWAGMAPHLGGLHLAQLRMVQRMAEKTGDKAYVDQCKAWHKEGSDAMEKELWAGSYYLNYYEPETGKKSDDVMGYQLDGQWAATFHGLPGVFKADRVKTTLATIKKCNVALTPNIGAANFTRPDGKPLAGPKDAEGKEEVAYYGTHAMFCAELLVLAMTYMDAGEKDFGLDLARKFWENLVIEQRHPWDLPNMVDGLSGKRLFGTDYYQCMMLWALPSSVYGQDMKTTCGPNGLVGRVLAAASGK